MALDLDAWTRDGYLPLGRLLDASSVAQLIAEEHRFRRRDARLVVTTQLMHRSAVIREIATRGPQMDALRALMGNDICLTHQQFVSKTPDPRAPAIDVPWHQDNGYGELAPKTDITVWFALDDCDERTGCLWVLPGSHRGPLLPHEEMHGLRGVHIDQLGGAPGVPLPMRAGEAVAFSGMLVHCSKAHTGTRTRHAFYLRYCEPQSRMLSHGGIPVLDDGYSWMVSGEAP